MASSRRARGARILLASAFLAAGTPFSPSLGAQGQGSPHDPDNPIPTAQFEKRDVVGGPWVNLATFPVRPMLYEPTGPLWVANHHDSTVERFVGLSSTPDRVFGVPWSPVAIAWWKGPGDAQPELLVVSRGTWSVVGIDPVTGAPKRVLQLRPGPALPLGLDAHIGRMAEPGDILVDEVNDRAFVSCTGADSVVQINLPLNKIERVFNQESDPAFRLKSPLFLSRDQNGTDVLCAPMHSGNNSAANRPVTPPPQNPTCPLPQPSDAPISDGLFNSTFVEDYEPSLPGEVGLPDQDLFRIKPYLNASSTGSVEVVLSKMGTILFAHGLHPNTHEFWQLNTDANNKNPLQQTEPDVQGGFAQNRISIVANTSGVYWGSASSSVSLDPAVPGPIDKTNNVGQPFALAFATSGVNLDKAFVAGLLTDNVMMLNPNGTFALEWDLPAGAIPRGILAPGATSALVRVYCWGLNQVNAYVWSPTLQTYTPRATHYLRHDPTPPLVAQGRQVFFESKHSQENNVSCASCHIEGGNDFLVWNLSNGPLEQKGPMFTQTRFRAPAAPTGRTPPTRAA